MVFFQQCNEPNRVFFNKLREIRNFCMRSKIFGLNLFKTKFVINFIYLGRKFSVNMQSFSPGKEGVETNSSAAVQMTEYFIFILNLMSSVCRRKHIDKMANLIVFYFHRGGGGVVWYNIYGIIDSL